MPWLIGFLFGYFLHLNRAKKFKLSWLAAFLKANNFLNKNDRQSKTDSSEMLFFKFLIN